VDGIKPPDRGGVPVVLRVRPRGSSPPLRLRLLPPLRRGGWGGERPGRPARDGKDPPVSPLRKGGSKTGSRSGTPPGPPSGSFGARYNRGNVHPKMPILPLASFRSPRSHRTVGTRGRGRAEGIGEESRYDRGNVHPKMPILPLASFRRGATRARLASVR